MDSAILVFATFLASMLVVGYLACERGGGNRVGYGLRFLSARLPFRCFIWSTRLPPSGK